MDVPLSPNSGVGLHTPVRHAMAQPTVPMMQIPNTLTTFFSHVLPALSSSSILDKALGGSAWWLLRLRIDPEDLLLEPGKPILLVRRSRRGWVGSSTSDCGATDDRFRLALRELRML